MKTTPLVLIFFLTALELWAQPSPGPRSLPQRVNLATNAPAFPAMPPASSPLPAAAPSTLSAPSAAPAVAPAVPAASKPAEEMIPPGNINFQGVDVNQVLDVYAQLVGRTLLRAGLPPAQIILRTETPLTKTEAIQALQAVLALNGIALVNVGDKFVKVLPVDQANSAGAKLDHGDASQLPDMGSYVTHIVQLKYVKPSVMAPLIQPFAKLTGAIFPIDDNGILVLRDNAENVKRMLEMIDQIDVSVPAEYISEVIPIKYALAEDIAGALNSLGGSGGSTVSIGGSSAGSSTTGGNGLRPTGGTTGSTGTGGTPGGQQRGIGSQAAPGTPTGGNTFQDRLRSIIQRASGGQQDQIQVFGQAKIIADQRSNSLLIFATQADMDRIKAVIEKLDVLLSQVLIESVIMEVSLNKSLNVGVSAVQNPNAVSSPNFKGTGGYNNGQSFFTFVTNGLSAVGTNVTSSLAGGFNYFGEIGNANYDVAIQAAASDNSISIIQKPRIQTFQAQKASFFVGQTVPYVTGSTYGSAYGNSSSYAQLSVGVELDVTPFINPDGLVVMEISEEIDDINGSTFIQGVGDVPNTDKRTLSSQVAVKDRDTIILGGAIRSQKTANNNGVPLLKDIPILGVLFSSKTSSKTRDELLVLMRPTVLKTPELAAIQAKKEESRLPGIANAEAKDNEEQRKQVEAENKAERIAAQKEAQQEAQKEAKLRKHDASTPTTVTPTNNSGSTQPDPNAAWR
jgi:general secretion pathway protein D